MKKIISVFMAVTLLLAFAACSNQKADEKTTPETTLSAVENEGTAAEPSESKESKTLVVYFSASGNTENAAKHIAEATKGDLFELEPKEPYTDDDLNWRDENSRVNYEHENEGARDIELVSSAVENWESYDTVFIGYPIWWQIAAWPVNNFVKNNDFTGKTVIPFCTSTSSGLCESGNLLEEMAGTGNWLAGKRFSGNVSQSEIQEWVNKLAV